MQEAVEAQSISVEGIWCKLSSKFTELLFNLLRHPHIKDSLHQRLNREEMGIDVFKISDGLLNRLALFFNSTRCSACSALGGLLVAALAAVLLQILQYPPRQGAE